MKLHSDIDAKFESMLTDNQETEEVFNRATAEKTARRRMLQEVVDLKEALATHEDGSSLDAKRKAKAAAKDRVGAFRPHNQDLKQMERIRDNYKTLLGLGFLETKVLQSNIGQILNVPQAVARPGRPINIPLSYEDMMTVDEFMWDDSKLIYQKANLQGAEQFFLGSMLSRESNLAMNEDLNKGANQALAMPVSQRMQDEKST